MRVTCLALILCTLPAFAQGRKVAFLVGVGEYKHFDDRLQLGRTPVNDVDELEKVLKPAGYTVYKFTDKAATKEAVEASFKLALNGQRTATDARNPLGRDDQLFFHFSGHGIEFDAVDSTDAAKQKKLQPFFVVHNSQMGDISGSMVAVNGLLREVNTLQVRTLFLMDACRNIVSPLQNRDIGITNERVELRKGISLLMSCASTQKSKQNMKVNHGLFTLAVLQCLRGETGRHGDIMWDDLVNDVKVNFRRGKVKELLGEDLQTPVNSEAESRDVLLVKVGVSSKVPMPSVPVPVVPVGVPKAGEERSLDIGGGLKMVFCWIPEGEAQLGSPKAEREAVLKNLDLKEEPDWLKAESEDVRPKFKTKGFWLAKFTVTQEEWISVMGHLGYSTLYTESNNNGKDKVAGINTDRFPVDCASWDDCQNMLSKLNARVDVKKAFGKIGKLTLPHEDQWEYAYRGGMGNNRAYYWGDMLNGDKANHDGNSPFGTITKGSYKERTMRVGSFADTAPHPWNLCDMSGNVLQWCANLYKVEGTGRVLRGGSWNESAIRCRASCRDWEPPRDISRFHACRLVLALD